MHGNREGDDAFQRTLELEHHLWRQHCAQLPPPPPPPEEALDPVITEGLGYAKIPTKFEYPCGFGVGFPTRIVILNRFLLKRFGVLAQCINSYTRAKVILEHNKLRPELKNHQLEQLHANVHIARSRANGLVCHILRLLGEVDFVGGSYAYYIPQVLQCENTKELGIPKLEFSIASGSLVHLAEQEFYIAEECDVSPNLCMDGANVLGRANQERKDLFEDLAFSVNMIQYMVWMQRFLS